MVVDSLFEFSMTGLFRFISYTAHSGAGISCFFPWSPGSYSGKAPLGPGVLTADGLIIVSRSQVNFNNSF